MLRVFRTVGVRLRTARLGFRGLTESADKLNLSIRQHANHKTRKLAEERAFRGEKDVCSMCRKSKLVIRTT